MIDLSELNNDTPLRATLCKKRQKERDRLAKIEEKAAPIRAEIAMYDKMISAIDERDAEKTMEEEVEV